MKATLALTWERFKIIAGIVGDVQGRFFAVAFYFTFLVPFGLIARRSGDPLRLKGGASWLEREPVGNNLEDARRQG